MVQSFSPPNKKPAIYLKRRFIGLKGSHVYQIACIQSAKYVTNITLAQSGSKLCGLFDS